MHCSSRQTRALLFLPTNPELSLINIQSYNFIASAFHNPIVTLCFEFWQLLRAYWMTSRICSKRLIRTARTQRRLFFLIVPQACVMVYFLTIRASVFIWRVSKKDHPLTLERAVCWCSWLSWRALASALLPVLAAVVRNRSICCAFTAGSIFSRDWFLRSLRSLNFAIAV